MKQIEQPLYPKLSSIYNKIMQLAIAIVLIIVLLNLWLASSNQSKDSIEEHFYVLGEQHLRHPDSVRQSTLAHSRHRPPASKPNTPQWTCSALHAQR